MPELLPRIQAGLKLFEQAPPTGVRVPAEDGKGVHYAQYSFWPSLRILNGFVQSLVGLYDVAELTGDPRAAQLFAEGELAARARGAGVRHRRLVALLARGDHARVRPELPHAAARLPDRPVRPHRAPRSTAAPRPHFTEYLTIPPALALKTVRVRGGTASVLRFTLSKISRATITVTAPDGKRVLSVAAGTVGRGTRTRELDGAAQAGRVRGAGRRDRPRRQRRERRGAGRGAQAEAQAAREVGSGPSMAPRTILYTGKGGVGKTSVAAATARRCAAAGLRTVVLSTDPAHSLADVLEAPVGDEPTELAPNLWAQQVSAQVELERHWSAVQGWLGQVLIERGVERIAAEELTVPPGGDELFSLLRLKRHVEAGGWDVIVVDCAPTGETLRLLSFPEAARWWLGKLVGRETQLLAAARPLARAFLDLRLPDEEVMGEVQGLVANLVAMHDLLRDRDAVSVRLVMTPDRMVVAEAMRTFTYLSLYGYLTDAVIVNRVFPDELAGTYFGAWRELPAGASWSGCATASRRSRCCARRTSRPRSLGGGDARPARRTPCSPTDDPAALLHTGLAQEFGLEDGGGHVRLAVPFADKGDVSLKKVGDELVVRVDGRKRTVVLPPALAALRPAGAALDDGALVVRFA